MAKKSLPSTNSGGKGLGLELARVSQELEGVRASNQRIEELLRVLAQPGLLTSLPEIFKDGKQLQAYQLSDGKRSTREIGRIVGVDQKTISRWWRAWKKEHRIIEKAGKRGQFRARFSLSEIIALHSGAGASAALASETSPAGETGAEQAPLF